MNIITLRYLIVALLMAVVFIIDSSNLLCAASINENEEVCADVKVASLHNTDISNVLLPVDKSVSVTITNKDQTTSLYGLVQGRDESGALRFAKDIKILAAGQTQIDFDVHGYVDLSIELRREAEDHVCHASTLSFGRISPPTAEQKGEFMGLWHVSGPFKVLPLLGAKWTRQFFSINCYRPDALGISCDAGLIDKKNSQLLRIPNVKVIGTLCAGFPDWIEQLPILGSDRKKIYPIADHRALGDIFKSLRNDIDGEPEYFEIYNEPDAKFAGSKAELAEFIKDVGHAIKEAFPNTKVLGPSFYKIRPEFFFELVKLGVLDNLDGIAMHAYVRGTAPEGEFINNVDLLLELIPPDKKNLPVFLTEFGWTTGRGGTWQNPVSELDQARYIARAALLLAARDIDVSVFFNLYWRGAPNNGEGDFSLLRSDGSPKPGLLAFSTVARWIDSWVGKKPKAYKLSRGRFLVVSQVGSNFFGALWSLEEDAGTVHVPGLIIRLESIMGESLPLASGRSLRISPSPVFFELTGCDIQALLRSLGD